MTVEARRGKRAAELFQERFEPAKPSKLQDLEHLLGAEQENRRKRDRSPAGEEKKEA